MNSELPAFRFETVPAVLCEWGAAQALGATLAEWYSERRALIVTDAGLLKAGVIAPALESLKAAGFQVDVFDDVIADPPESVVQNCVDRARTSGTNLVIGLGGGSSMDVAKLVAVMVPADQPLAELYGIGKVTGGRLPLVQIPTTAGTGSEVTNISILTTGESMKMGVVAPQLYADLVVLDAELTCGLPRLHTAASGIDAMVHAIEAYTSRIKKNPVSDALACEALRLLSGSLVAACEDGTNRPAREAMLLGAMLAGQAFANAPVGAVHALAYPLSGRFHITHGLSNALMLGPVLRFNMVGASGLYAELADVVAAPSAGSNAGRAGDFAAFMENLMNQSGAPRRLREAGVTEDKLSLMADDAMLQTRLLQNNPVSVSLADAERLYREAY